MKKFLRAIGEDISDSILLDDAYYKSNIENTYFSSIEPFDKGMITAWVDGGNNEIFSSPAYSYQLVKIGVSVWEGKNKKKSITKEIAVYADAALQIHSDEEHPLINRLNRGFKTNLGKITTPQQVIELFRRCFEIYSANEISKEVEFVCLDGNLIAQTDIEEELIAENENLIAIAKSSTLSTKNRSLYAALSAKSDAEKLKTWLASGTISASNDFHKAIVSFAKLHPKSPVIIRIDTKENLKNAFAAHIASLSQDPVFLGYPYPLVKADQLARVSNEEMQYHRTKTLIHAKELGVTLEKEDMIKNTHDILDAIRF